jgi:hypothetical protein
MVIERFFCEECRDRTVADLDGTNAMCDRCGESYSCGECGFEIDSEGRCLHSGSGAGECAEGPES